ncbi:TetR/AcrR family transcriptional regulator [Streptomyces palmae]|uniref:TetR family transcriptional regulator n=1 Tax=Streptomyces palmae TaxID=1701085 RepID=A0A4Z0G0M2_9ACTN|nr:TetR/AcrR family transcriptional regulator [Streptomyces palmae]TGA87445.1 TetR family transcriptional regulator [Streptomyces palmae]
MPARGDHDAKRRDVSEAVWRVLGERGFGGLTLRAVAAELGASTGLVSHYFPSKRALMAHALEVAEERTANRALRTPPGPGLAGLRSALLDVLPLTEEMAGMSRAWVSSWDAALADPGLSAGQAARYLRWCEVLRGHLEAARELGELPADTDPEDLATVAAAFTHGLVVQALFDPKRLPPTRQTALLDSFLDGLARKR